VVVSSERAAAELTFRDPFGEPASVLADVEPAQTVVGEFLTGRYVWLEGTRAWQLRVAEAADRSAGYERLDNEILAGRRLSEVAGGDLDYPACVSMLLGDEAESAEPFALLEPYTGEPLGDVVGTMADGEQDAFETGLLEGLCWLDSAGIAHRGLTPSTVRWDGIRQQVQITGFSLCTVFGVPREATGSRDWAGPEQQAGRKVSGQVSDRDDLYSFAKLVYYVRNQGTKLTKRDQLGDAGLLRLNPLIGPPQGRPTARTLYRERAGREAPAPRGLGDGAQLKLGYEAFDARRRKKHPGLQDPPPPPVPPPPPPPGPFTPRQAPGAGPAADSGKRRFRFRGHS
jgi:serine/threonine protein kinase